ncbi:hypothetical protein WJX72_004493 [[Myrmecia] bisecta]|uniref:RRM domain-containing protein n=1 Tax=[Myrmecia] bisecta TaxID=41462 RepID=A0AAW1Q1M1_9CHLO
MWHDDRLERDYSRGGRRDEPSSRGSRSYSDVPREKKRGNPDCTVFVTNLSYSTQWKGLKDHFKAAGEVAYANVMTDMETGRSRGRGVVEFATVEDAQKAVDELDGSDLDGRQISVRPDRDAAGGGGQPADSRGGDRYERSGGRDRNDDSHRNRRRSPARGPGGRGGGRGGGRERREGGRTQEELDAEMDEYMKQKAAKPAQDAAVATNGDAGQMSD